jgi:DNA-binding ferritin-like protein
MSNPIASLMRPNPEVASLEATLGSYWRTSDQLLTELATDPVNASLESVASVMHRSQYLTERLKENVSRVDKATADFIDEVFTVNSTNQYRLQAMAGKGYQTLGQIPFKRASIVLGPQVNLLSSSRGAVQSAADILEGLENLHGVLDGLVRDVYPSVDRVEENLLDVGRRSMTFTSGSEWLSALLAAVYPYQPLRFAQLCLGGAPGPAQPRNNDVWWDGIPLPGMKCLRFGEGKLSRAAKEGNLIHNEVYASQRTFCSMVRTGYDEEIYYSTHLTIPTPDYRILGMIQMTCMRLSTTVASLTNAAAKQRYSESIQAVSDSLHQAVQNPHLNRSDLTIGFKYLQTYSYWMTQPTLELGKHVTKVINAAITVSNRALDMYLP